MQITKKRTLTGLAATLFLFLTLFITTALIRSCNNGKSGLDTLARPQTTQHNVVLKRLATVPLGAEITGLTVAQDGDLFFNAQHPSTSNPAPFNQATIGVIENFSITQNQDFRALAVASTKAQKQRVRVAQGNYKILASEGDIFAGKLPEGIGAILDSSGTRPLLKSRNPDFNGFIPVDVSANQGYLFTNWEEQPGGMSRLSISRSNGKWTASDPLHVDFSGVRGTWFNCFGSISPWHTPLSSEEIYYDNTADWYSPAFGYAKGVAALQAYLKGVFPNPYDYGYIIEITRPRSANPVPVKHFTLGRFSHENAVVMPDNKTVYLSDDGTGTVFFKFVADRPNDLSAGTLYAAKVKQDVGKKDPGMTGFDIEWTRLAHANDQQVQGWIREYDARGNHTKNYITQQQIDAWAAGKAKDERVAFLESRKAAIAKGATGEFRKTEGVNINYASARNGTVPFMYLAISTIDKTMSDGKGAIRLNEHQCGAVYRMRLNKNYDVKRMEPWVVGGTYQSGLMDNQCPLDQVANPDNLIVLKDGRVVVGEDSSYHENNMLWVVQPVAD